MRQNNSLADGAGAPAAAAKMPDIPHLTIVTPPSPATDTAGMLALGVRSPTMLPPSSFDLFFLSLADS